MSIPKSNSYDDFKSILGAAGVNTNINKTIAKSSKSIYKKSNFSDTAITTFVHNSPVHNLSSEKVKQPPTMGWFEYIRAYIRGSKDPSILNLKRVDDTVIRSAAPFYKEDFIRLKNDYNVNTIIDLRGLGTTKQQNIGWAKEQATKANIANYVHIPIRDSKQAPKQAQLNEALEAIRAAKRAGTSVLIQCRHGIDRTGTFVAYYQAKELKKSKEDVLQYMRECGYDWYHEWSRPAQKKAVLSFFDS
jgi:hypothetical protein